MVESIKGAYGLRLGPPIPDHRLVEAPPTWVSWRIEWRHVSEESRQVQRLGPNDALIDVQPVGQVHVDRESMCSTLLLPVEPLPEAWVHPHLSSTAVLTTRWFGRQAFHAGGFVFGGGVWGVLGDRDQGKSSMLAWLGIHDCPIVCDDVLIIDGDSALAGPRCLDLRETASQHFGIGIGIGHIGTRERWRVDLPPVDAELPLKGWVVLAWGSSTDIRPVPTGDRLGTLFAHRGLTVPEEDGRPWLRLVSRPFVTFQRPRSWDKLDDAMAELLDVLSKL